MATPSTRTRQPAQLYVIKGQCVPRFDHEAGKSDHYHREFPYNFVSLVRLLEDFWRLVDAYSNH